MKTLLDTSPGELRREPHAAWRLLLTVHAVLTREVDQALRSAGQLSFEAYDVLITLSEAPAGKMRMSDLAGATLLSHSGISRSVARLVGQGLLRREQCEADGRVFYAILTDDGRQALHEAWPHYREVIERQFVRYCNDRTAAGLNRLFARILQDHDAERFTPIVVEKRTDAPA